MPNPGLHTAVDECGLTQWQLTDNWQVCSIPLDVDISPEHISFTNAFSIPDSVHLQPFLYPDKPYWGEHLRAINEKAWVYRRVFTVPNIPYVRARLFFEGVDYFASVWLNGYQMGQHEGHFASFSFDVTHALRANQENVLLVRVSSPWDKAVPTGSYPIDHVKRGLVKGLYEHGEGVIPPNVNPIGIWRPVSLVFDQGISIDHLRIQAGTDGIAAIRLTITNTTPDLWHGTLRLNIEAENHQGDGSATEIPIQLSSGTCHYEYLLEVRNPHLWWCWDHGNPHLYRLTACLQKSSEQIVSTRSDTFGFRTIQLERTQERFTYYLNGRPVFLRGSSYMPSLYLSQCNRESLAHDIRLAQAANLNLLRVHVHVSRPELYDLCDQTGMMIWQDFELNWIQDESLSFEERARALQHDMIETLYNHPSIMTWSCHNEPTMVFARRHNLEDHPDPALYADALRQDTTRPVFICSGQMEHDWQRAGDVHTYYGALWTSRYTDVYSHHPRLNTEFGFEAPAARETLQLYPDCWERLQHLDDQIEDLWAYQAELVRFHIEHFRRLRDTCCAGYIHFWFADLVPQVGYGILDSQRQKKGGYAALQQASQPLQVALEHDGRRCYAVWVFNDTPDEYPDLRVRWRVYSSGGKLVYANQVSFDVAANKSQCVMNVDWAVEQCAYVQLDLQDTSGNMLANNSYNNPLKPRTRPKDYPWKFDPFLGFKVFSRPDAPSLADQTTNPIIKRVPLSIRERVAEWGLRQRLPHWLVQIIAHQFGHRFL